MCFSDQSETKVMKLPQKSPLQVVIDDLKVLIDEIETYPHISSWTIRMVLKSIREKAEQMAQEDCKKEAEDN
jgi:hypothetical protein